MPIVAPVPTSPTVEMTIKATSDMRISQWCDRRLVTRRPRARAPVRARGRFLCAARRDLQDVWYDAWWVLWVGVCAPLAASLSPMGRGSLSTWGLGLLVRA